MTKWDFEVELFTLNIWNCGAVADLEINCVPFNYGYEYFYSRYPLEKTKFWNLIYLFKPEAWMWTFISIFTIIISLYLARSLAVQIGLSVNSTEEIVLFPFRFPKQGSVDILLSKM